MNAALQAWLKSFWDDLQPTPGRLGCTLRIVLASVLTLVLLLVWQVPYTSLGLYCVFLFRRNNPSVSLRSVLYSYLGMVAAVIVEFAVVILTDNDPMARVLSIAFVAFISGMLMIATTTPSLGCFWGFTYCALIANWEYHTTADVAVRRSLWLVAACTVGFSCAIAMEYIFNSRNPATELQKQSRMRYLAVGRMFNLFASEAKPGELATATSYVTRLAAAGPAEMQRLHHAIVRRNPDAYGDPARIILLARLMDFSAAFAMYTSVHSDPEFRERCAGIARQCHAFLSDSALPFEQHRKFRSDAIPTLLDSVEDTLHNLRSMQNGNHAAGNEEPIVLPQKQTGFFVPGVFNDKNTVAYALKLSLCATICYVLYHAVDWPGISTCVPTVLVAALSTTGTMKQKSVHRFLGSVIGGLVLGLGSTAFLFPYMDSITSLIILVACVTFLAAWCGRGRRFNYVGRQLAFSFYLVAFEGFGPPMQLAPARDRLIGIILALTVMWLVFDQMWPVRTTSAMRQVLATILHDTAAIFQLTDTAKQYEVSSQHSDVVRSHFAKTLAELQTMNDAVKYEYGTDRESHVRSGKMMMKAALASRALFWNELAMLHNTKTHDCPGHASLSEMRCNIAKRLDALADGMLGKTPTSIADATTFTFPAFIESPLCSEYAGNVRSRYEELQAVIAGLEATG
jgi:multidrug resistance protein MdtO